MLSIEMQLLNHKWELEKVQTLDLANKEILKLELQLEEAKKEYKKILDYYFALGI